MGNAFTVAEWILHVIKFQYAITRIITFLIDKMNRNASTGNTSMLENRISKRTDLLQGKSRALRKETYTAFRNAATQCEGAANAQEIRPNSDGDGLRLGDTDDMITAVVGGGIGLGGLPDSVPQDLYHRFRGGIIPSGSWTQGGASAVNTQGRSAINSNCECNDAEDEERM